MPVPVNIGLCLDANSTSRTLRISSPHPSPYVNFGVSRDSGARMEAVHVSGLGLAYELYGRAKLANRDKGSFSRFFSGE
jgi:hypothetical protein